MRPSEPLPLPALLGTVLEPLGLVVYTCSVQGEIRLTSVSENVKALTGFTPKEFLGSPSFWADHVHPEDAPGVFAAFPRLFADGRRYSYEYRWRTADGAYKWFHDMHTLVKRSDDEVDHVLGVWQDITERKRAEQERERLVAELQEAVAKIRTLSGLLPVCASCRRVRNDRGYWDNLEAYIERNSDARISHGICPECMRMLYPNYPDSER